MKPTRPGSYDSDRPEHVGVLVANERVEGLGGSLRSWGSRGHGAIGWRQGLVAKWLVRSR
jgi:hypothetical protein